MKLNVITGKHPERMPRLLNELQQQGIKDYQFWPSIILPSVKKSINLAHKQIVEDAYNSGLEEVCIAEDDFKATHPNSWNFYLQNKPPVFDLYLSSVFNGDLNEQDRVVSFTGLSMYCIHSKFYPTFLTIPEDDHIDVLLGGLGDYHVCNPFTFIQHNGMSGNTGKVENYDQFFQNRKLYTG